MGVENIRYSKPELAARKVLDECGINDPTECSISKIILSRKVFYEEAPLNNKDGEIVSVGGRSIITVNSTIQYETRKRFAAAHELGHFELHKDLRPIFSDTEEDLMNWYKSGPHELEANQFAAEFLMPSDIFYNECARKKFTPQVIEHLSQKFQVSKTAAILKFIERGNHPIFVVYCKDNKMKWFRKSNDFKHFFPFVANDPPPQGSVAYEVFTKKKSYFGEEAMQDIWKSDWFTMKNNDEKDTPFHEYCLFVKSYNYTLSVIWEK